MVKTTELFHRLIWPDSHEEKVGIVAAGQLDSAGCAKVAAYLLDQAGADEKTLRTVLELIMELEEKGANK